MIIAIRADGRDDVVDGEPPPFDYPREGPYARQLLFNAIVAVVLAATTFTVGLSLAGFSFSCDGWHAVPRAGINPRTPLIRTHGTSRCNALSHTINRFGPTYRQAKAERETEMGIDRIPSP